MSRICVKNLPKSATETRLREIFEAKGEVTDVRIAKTANGKLRGFAFVGFRSDADATTARNYFDNTFIGTSRIHVELAKKVGDDSLTESALSKHTLKKLKAEKMKEITKQKEDRIKEAQEKKEREKLARKKQQSVDKQKAEFLLAMKSRKAAAAWANDDGMGDAIAAAIPNSSGSKQHIMQPESDDESDAYASESSDSENNLQQLRKQKKGEKSVALKQAAENDSDSDDDDSSSDNDDRKSHSKPFKDADSASAGVAPQDTVSQSQPTTTTAADSDRLFLRNLPFTCSEEDLTDLFGRFGPLTEVHIPIDADKKRKGFAFVQFMFPEHASKARRDLDGSSFQGRLLHIIPANDKKGAGESGDGVEEVKLGSGRLSAYQAKKEAARKLLAGKTEGWHAAHVRSDAVVASLAKKFGVQASDVLDTAESAGEMAVRMAIGEASVIQENNEYFATHGVNIGALESQSSDNRASKRSNTTLLVKNLPHDMIPEELEAMFSRFGSISAFLVPPSKTVAMVDFLEPVEARQAFKSLAYRKYKHLPLYLEWAPLDVIASKDKANAATSTQVGKHKATEEIEEDVDGYCSLYVKNLNFATTEDALRTFVALKGVDGLRGVSIPKKAKGALQLSQGFGFVEFNTSENAAAALSKLRGSVLDGHSLEAKPSDKRLTPATSTSSSTKRPRSEAAGDLKIKSSKLIVRNVPFQATQTELRALFSSFGTLKRVRIPKKMGGSHRGFAFVEFSSPQEATVAMNSLSATHLYGRHLVIEWAKADDEVESIEALRKKARAEESIQGKLGQRRKKEQRDDFADEASGDVGDSLE